MADKEERLRYYIEAIWRGGAATTQAKEGIKGVGEQAKQGEGGLKGFNDKLGMLTGIAAGAAGAVQVFKTAFEFAKEGDAIQRLEGKLDSLTAKIGTTSQGIITGMREATNGSVADLDLMNAAVTFLNMGFVNSQQGAEDLIQKIVLLKKPTEDTSTAIENFSLMLANQSIARLDSFGISAGAVKERIDELQKANEGMTRQQAFTIATMEQMDVAIQNQGLSAETLGSSYDRLGAMLQNTTNDFKQLLDQGLNPVVAVLAGDYNKATEQAAQNALLQAQANGTLSEQLEKTHGSLELATSGYGRLTGTSDELMTAQQRLVMEIARTSATEDEFIAAIEGSSVAATYNITALKNLYEQAQRVGGGVKEATDRIKDFGTVNEQTADKTEQTAAAVQHMIDALANGTAVSEYGTHLSQFRATTDEYGRTEEQVASAIERTAAAYEMLDAGRAADAQALADQKTANDAAREALAEHNAALGDMATNLLNVSQENRIFTGLLDGSSTQMVTVSTRTAEQNTQLDHLQDAYNRAAKKIQDYETRIIGVNLSDDERNKKIAEQQTIMQNAQAAMEPLLAMTTQYADEVQSAAINQEALNNQAYQWADAAGASAEQLVMLEILNGNLSKAEGERLLAEIALTTAAEMYAEQLAQGKITAEEYMDRVNKLAAEFNNAGTSADDAATKVGNLRTALENLPTERTVRVRAQVDDMPPLPDWLTDGSGGGGNNNKGGDGKGNKKAAMGANFIVPPGYPGDSFNLAVSSGEHVVVTPGTEKGKAGGVTIQQLIIQVMGANSQSPRAWGEQLASAFMGELGAATA